MVGVLVRTCFLVIAAYGFLGVCLRRERERGNESSSEQAGYKLDGLVWLGRMVFVEERTHNCALTRARAQGPEVSVFSK